MGAPVDQGLIEAADRLRRLADFIAADRPVDRGEALWLMLMLRDIVESDDDRQPDPRLIRRTALRRIWQNFYPNTPRTTAARLMAVEWRSAAARDDAPAGTIADYFQRLSRSNIRPVSERQIMDDLDYDL
ncbi:hypothetical protein [Mesorhizobium sp. L-2-11]|uniref:hypothetical protein n=1 Tax=Mesorhizobium sp. L-2-11 TaxID=2744521 RepID=UPI00192560E9|nr:hypothetical protein [Mesorhizobium sp. L-2-11]BCH18865.1 hypothetical protein MesoLjLa_57160 [Mesorhizobium sp. L-2-11]